MPDSSNTLIRFVGCALACLLVSGCAVIEGMPAPPDTSTAAYPNHGYQLGPAAITKYNALTDGTEKRILRNEIIDARMAEIDSKFRDFERALYKQGVGAGIGTDWTLLAFTAASTLSTVNQTKTTLSAISTAIVGGEASFKKEALFDKTMPALMAQMHAERETLRAEIRGKEKLPVSDYSWFAAESDLMQYEFAGTIPAAISAVAQDAGAKATKAKSALIELDKGTYSNTDSAKALTRFWMPDGKTANPENEKRLLKWMGEHNFATDRGSIPMFIIIKEQEEARKTALKDLGIEK